MDKPDPKRWGPVTTTGLEVVDVWEPEDGMMWAEVRTPEGVVWRLAFRSEDGVLLGKPSATIGNLIPVAPAPEAAPFEITGPGRYQSEGGYEWEVFARSEKGWYARRSQDSHVTYLRPDGTPMPGSDVYLNLIARLPDAPEQGESAGEKKSSKTMTAELDVRLIGMDELRETIEAADDAYYRRLRDETARDLFAIHYRLDKSDKFAPTMHADFAISEANALVARLRASPVPGGAE